jgi:hypothetical protein
LKVDSRRRACGRVCGTSYAKEYLESDGEYLAIENERQIMLILSSPILANALYIGGGSVGLLLLIVVVVLLLRG